MVDEEGDKQETDLPKVAQTHEEVCEGEVPFGEGLEGLSEQERDFDHHIKIAMRYPDEALRQKAQEIIARASQKEEGGKWSQKIRAILGRLRIEGDKDQGNSR